MTPIAPRAHAAQPRAARGWARKLAWAVVAAALWGVAAYYLGFHSQRELKDDLVQLRGGLQSLGFWGPAAYAGIYAVAALLVPGAVLTMFGGALFGLVRGTVAVWLGATAGSALAFLIARHLARDWVAARIARRPAFAKIDRAVGEQGLKIVFLLRLSPVFPFLILNFMLGLTRVRFVDYVLASVGMLPGTLLYVYYGKLGGDIAQIAAGVQPAEHGAAYWLVTGVGLAATLAASVLVARLARRALEQELPEEEGA
jgi:uncharacterized membrane protein YdjX (TVP38/TMEM64 family)